MKLDRTSYLTIIGVLGVALVLALLNQMTPVTSAAHVPTYILALAGKYLCFAMLALAVDLVWGFAGILSLGHAAFFALGGYAMGMYLMRQIGTRGVYGNPNLPDFMVFLGWKELPWYWYGFELVRLRHADGDRGAGGAGRHLRLAGVSLTRDRGLSFDYYAGADLRAAAGVLPQ